jgi:hypothetical protein
VSHTHKNLKHCIICTLCTKTFGKKLISHIFLLLALLKPRIKSFISPSIHMYFIMFPLILLLRLFKLFVSKSCHHRPLFSLNPLVSIGEWQRTLLFTAHHSRTRTLWCCWPVKGGQRWTPSLWFGQQGWQGADGQRNVNKTSALLVKGSGQRLLVWTSWDVHSAISSWTGLV